MAPLHASLGLTSWTWEPTVLAGVLALAAAYVWMLRGGAPGSWSAMARIYFAAIWVIFFRLDDKEATAGERPVVEIETPVRMG